LGFLENVCQNVAIFREKEAKRREFQLFLAKKIKKYEKPPKSLKKTSKIIGNSLRVFYYSFILKKPTCKFTTDRNTLFIEKRQYFLKDTKTQIPKKT
jgi:hypothetical protein